MWELTFRLNGGALELFKRLTLAENDSATNAYDLKYLPNSQELTRYDD